MIRKVLVLGMFVYYLFSLSALLLVIYPAFWEFRKFPLWLQISNSHLLLNDSLCNCFMTIAPWECMYGVRGGGRSWNVPPSLCRDPRTALWQQVSLLHLCGFQSGTQSFQAFEIKAVTSESPSQSFYIILTQFQQKMLLLYFFTICSNGHLWHKLYNWNFNKLFTYNNVIIY